MKAWNVNVASERKQRELMKEDLRKQFHSALTQSVDKKYDHLQLHV